MASTKLPWARRKTAVDVETRGIRPPPTDIVPNANDPASVPPATVGPDQLVEPGDPHGVQVVGDAAPAWIPPAIWPSGWSGWPAEWWPPPWRGTTQQLSDIAWACLDLNASVLASMPPYLINAAPSLDTDWIRNPDPSLYTSWDEFAKQLFWDYQSGEAFVIATARYSTGWPARFHVLPSSLVEVDLGGDGTRVYRVGDVDVTQDVLHIRYTSSVDDARGHGALEVAANRIRAAAALNQYGSTLASAGGIPPSVLEHPEQLSPEQARKMQTDWVLARQSTLGEPAVLSGGVTWKPTALNPTDMALLDLAGYNEARIAVLLKVPPPLVGLSGVGDSLTYNTMLMALDQHWRAGLRPIASAVMSAMSEWLIPRGTTVEVNKDAYVQPDPKTRAETYEILSRITDADGNPAITVSEIRQAERLMNTSTPVDLSSGVLK